MYFCNFDTKKKSINMSSFGLGYFDKALDSVIDGLENSVVDRTRAIASDLLSEEFKAPAHQPNIPADSLAVLSKLKDVTGYWRLFNIQVWFTCEIGIFFRNPKIKT